LRWGIVRDLFLAACLFLAPGLAVAEDVALEYAVKATCLYKFAPFSEWPDGVLGPAGVPLRLCVAGQDPFGPVLERALKDQQIAGRAIDLVRLGAADRTAGCAIMFIGADGKAAHAAIDGLRGAPVLTVTDGKADPTARGIINFVLVEGRVRFEIDAHEATRSGLTISSKLLAIALGERPH